MTVQTSTVLAALTGLLLTSIPAEAQFGRILRRAAEAEAERRVNDVVEDVIRCTVGDDECAEAAEREGKEVVVVDDNGQPVEPDADAGVATSGSAEAPGEGVWRNYDFTPGRTVWYASDFTNERVGRFPSRQLGFVEGNAQIVELDGVKTLEASASTIFTVALPDVLPPDFSVEFTVQTATRNQGLDVYLGPRPTRVNEYESSYMRFGGNPGIYYQGDARSSILMNSGLSAQLHDVKLQVDGDYAVLYVDAERAANLPVADFVGADSLTFHIGANTNYRAYIRDIVVGVGIEFFADVLADTGEFTTRGIYFDTDSAVIRPESTFTPEDIRATLAGDEDLDVAIEGHTDNQGDEGYNDDLSLRRAQAVVTYLIGTGIEASRLSAIGRGESTPVADNGTIEGRAENRRVVVRRVN